MKNFYAVLIGINAYPDAPLSGCINDVLATSDYFQRLCERQERNYLWTPIYLLAPLNEKERKKINQKGIKNYAPPTRQNIVDSFEHFKKADPQKGDYCLFYYSGHGSYIFSSQVEIFEEYEPTGELQTIVCSDSRESGKRDLLDKELGYLIAKTLEGKAPSKEVSDHIPGVHFLSIMDCCHSGTNTRSGESDLISRMIPGKTDLIPADEVLGLSLHGNCYYKAFEKNQKKLKPGGIKDARYINIAAAQSTESAFETKLPVVNKSEKKTEETIHGVFTFNLLRILEQNGVNISYGDLIKRIQGAVRSTTDKQVPHLDAIYFKDRNLFFLRDEFSTPKKIYDVFFRQIPAEEWILNAGAIQGISPPPANSKTRIKLVDKNRPAIEVVEVRASESVLDPVFFTANDKNNLRLRAIIHQTALPQLLIGFGTTLKKNMEKKLKEALKKNLSKWFRLAKPGEIRDLEINCMLDNNRFHSYILTANGLPVAPMTKNFSPDLFIENLEKIARYRYITQMGAPAARIPRSDILVEIKALEGAPFKPDDLNDIAEDRYKSFPPNPDEIHVHFKKVNGKLIQPAIKVRITCENNGPYWIGCLYADSQYGITSDYLKVQRIGRFEYANLEFALEEKGVVRKWNSIPLTLSEEWRRLNSSQIQDLLILFISDAQQPFDLSHYQQQKIQFNRSKAFSRIKNAPPTVKDSWITIKIPIFIKLNDL